MGQTYGETKTYSDHALQKYLGENLHCSIHKLLLQAKPSPELRQANGLSVP